MPHRRRPAAAKALPLRAARPASRAQRGVVLLAGWLLLADALLSALWGGQ